MFKIARRYAYSFHFLQKILLTPYRVPRFHFSKELQLKQSEVIGKGFYQQQILTGCLAEYAYYIESNKQALIIDPLRDIDTYLTLAKERGATIKYILLTHFHADFVAGHISLAKATGAQIVMGPNAQAPYLNKVLQDGESLQLGQVQLKALHTPGHTQESTCFLLIDQDGKQHSLYSGDTLFLGEVGRPDLAVKSDLTSKDLAAMLYRSIRKNILSLPDEVIVFPGHGAGSACGKNISSGFSCNIGTQKKNNYALQPMTEDQFVEVVTNDLPKPPPYFFYNAGLNKQANLEDLSVILNRAKTSLSPKQVQALKNYTLLDCRPSISEGFIQGAINISLKIPFANWVGTLLPHDKDIVLVAEPGTEDQAIMRLVRIGYDRIVGFLSFEEWVKAGLPVVKPQEQEVQEFLKRSQRAQIVDVRTKEEWAKGVLRKAQLITLSELNKNFEKLDKNRDVSIYCGTGQRAKIAATLLAANGFTRVQYCKVGYEDIVK